MNNFSFGAIESKKDNRTVFHDELTTMADPSASSTGGYDYLPEDIEHQHKVGICTAISLTQNAQKAIGRKFSPEFQYLCQKKYYDLNWSEGSSILNALKVGKNIGFLPIEEWTYTKEEDRLLPYDAYIAKLKAVPDSEIERLKMLCTDYKLSGYAQIDQADPMAISRAITASKSGILCMYLVGQEWWTPSWNSADIDPLKAPVNYVSGHAISMTKYDYTKSFMQKLANTWGITWDIQGTANINWLNYKMRECWIPYYGMTEAQLQELKAQLQAKLSLLQKIVALYTQLKALLKK